MKRRRLSGTRAWQNRRPTSMKSFARTVAMSLASSKTKSTNSLIACCRSFVPVASTRAEAVWQKPKQQYREEIDWLDRRAALAEARGDKKTAAEFYRRCIAF